MGKTYPISKLLLTLFTRVLASEGHPGVRFVAVCPGFVLQATAP